MPIFSQLIEPIARLMRSKGEWVEQRWTKKHDWIVQNVLRQLTEHAGLMLPTLTKLFILEVHYDEGGYSGALLQ